MVSFQNSKNPKKNVSKRQTVILKTILLVLLERFLRSYGGNGLDFTTSQTYTSTQGNHGGSSSFGSYGSGGGGGGSGQVGGNPIFLTNNPTLFRERGGDGGNGLSNSITGTAIFYAGGGAGGTNTNSSSTPSTSGTPTGGSGGVGNGNLQQNNNGTPGSNGLGGGGGGGYEPRTIGASGGSGIVIIKFKSIVNDSIPEGNPITHKTLNFTYVPPAITYDFTNFNRYSSWTAEATRIGATYSLNAGFTGPSDNGVYFGGYTIGFIQLPLQIHIIL